MVTEIQMSKSREHLGYLRKVLELFGAKVGMARKDLEATERAVSEIYASSITRCGEEGVGLSVKLVAEELYLSLEIRDDGADQVAACSADSEYAMLLERLRRFMDRAELVRRETGLTVCIEKRADTAEGIATGPARQLVPAGSTSLHT